MKLQLSIPVSFQNSRLQIILFQKLQPYHRFLSLLSQVNYQLIYLFQVVVHFLQVQFCLLRILALLKLDSDLHNKTPRYRLLLFPVHCYRSDGVLMMFLVHCVTTQNKSLHWQHVGISNLSVHTHTRVHCSKDYIYVKNPA